MTQMGLSKMHILEFMELICANRFDFYTHDKIHKLSLNGSNKWVETCHTTLTKNWMGEPSIVLDSGIEMQLGAPSLMIPLAKIDLLKDL